MKIEITRIEPGDQTARFDFDYTADKEKKISAAAKIFDFEDKLVQEIPIKLRDKSVKAEKVFNGVDYYVILQISDKDGISIAQSKKRLFRTGYVPGTVVNYIHPLDHAFMPSGRSPASPSLVRLPNGWLLASHDIYWGNAAQNLTHVFVSKDNGLSWAFQSQVYPSFWTKLFCHKGMLYAFGMDGEYGDMNIFSSEDNGQTWSKPVLMCKGGDRLKGGAHKAPMPVVEFKGRLWTAFEYGSWSLSSFHKAGFASIGVDEDLMDSKNWVISDFLEYSNDWEGVCKGKAKGYLEGNIVITPDNTIVDFLRYQTEDCTPNYGRAIMLYIDHENPSKAPAFGKMVKFHGNLSKFTIRYDEKSGYYFSLVSRVTQKKQLKQRNCLTLTRSKDLDNWEIVKDILNYEDNGWPEDLEKVGFQYIDWIFDEDDLIFLSRTAINGAHNYHNANHITFHRLRGFRDYMDI